MDTFTLPATCKVDKFIAKKMFIEKTAKGKEKFENIEKIRWLYKLSPSTLHLPKQGKVEEIQIFRFILKTQELPKEAIKSIKKIIPYPILFQLEYGEHFCYATYLIDDDKCYFSPWDELIEFNFNATNLEKVYESMVKKFLKDEVQKTKKDLKTSIQNDHQIDVLSKEIEVLKKKIAKEKQFNKKLELSRKLKPKEEALKKLTDQNI